MRTGDSGHKNEGMEGEGDPANTRKNSLLP